MSTDTLVPCVSILNTEDEYDEPGYCFQCLATALEIPEKSLRGIFRKDTVLWSELADRSIARLEEGHSRTNASYFVAESMIPEVEDKLAGKQPRRR